MNSENYIGQKRTMGTRTMSIIGSQAIIKTQKYDMKDNTVCHYYKANTKVTILKITSMWYLCTDNNGYEQHVGIEDLCPVNQENLKFN